MPIMWFMNNIGNPYIDRTNEFKPIERWLCHIAIVIGLCLIPLVIVLWCNKCDKQRALEKKNARDKVKSITEDKVVDYEKADFDSIPRFPLKIEEEPTPKVNRSVHEPKEIVSATAKPETRGKSIIMQDEPETFERGL